MVSDEIVTEIKAILHNLRVSGGAVTRKTVIVIGDGVIKLTMPRKIGKKWWKRDTHYKVGSGNLKVARLGEETWHNFKKRNEPCTLRRIDFLLEKKNC